MTNEELKSTGEALIALSEGKVAEYQDPLTSEWKRVLPQMLMPMRIKPAPAKRLIRAEELPAVFYIVGGPFNHFYLITEMTNLWSDGAMGFHAHTLQKSHGGSIIDLDKKGWKWSSDRIQIRSFWVEE